LKSISATSEWGEGSSMAKEAFEENDTMSMTTEMSRMSFEPTRHRVNRSMNLDNKLKRTIVSQYVKMN